MADAEEGQHGYTQKSAQQGLSQWQCAVWHQNQAGYSPGNDVSGLSSEGGGFLVSSASLELPKEAWWNLFLRPREFCLSLSHSVVFLAMQWHLSHTSTLSEVACPVPLKPKPA